MFAESTSNHNPDGFVIGPDGHAESSADVLHDFLVEHSDDPDEGPPEDWPDEYDSIRVAIGPAIFPQERFDPFDPLPDDEVNEIPF